MATTTIREVEASVVIDGKKRHPEEIIAEIGINSYPKIAITHYQDTHAADKAIDMSSADVCKEMGERQKQMFSETPTPASVSIYDGKGGRLQMSGWIQNPEYRFSAAQVNKRDVILPEYAAMDSINYSGYTIPTTANFASKDREDFKKHDNVPSLFLGIAGSWARMWQSHYAANVKNPMIASETQQQQHIINEQTWKYFKELMQESAATFGWDDLKKWCKVTSENYGDAAVITHCNKLLKNNSGSFLSTICRFAESFQAVYVPSWNRVGHLQNKTLLLNGNTKYKAETVQMDIRCGGRGMFPARYVSVTVAPPTSNFATGKGEGQQQQINYYVTYPETLRGNGAMIPVQAPPWLPSICYVPEVSGADTATRTALKIRNARNLAKKRKEQQKEFDKNKCYILQEWARCHYVWEALGNTAATIVVPLDLSPEVGKRYRVTNVQGKVLFTGALTRITHTIRSAGGRRGNCSTALRFTHLELPGFNLPE